MWSWPWPFSSWRDETVTCIACGTSLSRGDAREYDKYGDRWDRADKEFEHLCKPCYRELSRQPRGDLEAILVDVETRAHRGVDGRTYERNSERERTDERDRERDHANFCSAYLAALREREEALEERGRGRGRGYGRGGEREQ